MAKQTSSGTTVPPNNRDDEHLGERQVAAESPLTVAWLRAKRLRGSAGDGDAGPPFYKIGRKITYRRGDVRAYLEAHKVDRSKRALLPVTSTSSAA